MKQIAPYLNFDGNCREAMTFYQRCLGGTLEVMSMADGGFDAPPHVKDRVAHARITEGPAVLMASDTMMEGPPLQAGTNMFVNVQCSTPEELDRYFAALSEGGTPSVPPHDAFWGDRFAMLTDRYGVQWMFVADPAAQS